MLKFLLKKLTAFLCGHHLCETPRIFFFKVGRHPRMSSTLLEAFCIIILFHKSPPPTPPQLFPTPSKEKQKRLLSLRSHLFATHSCYVWVFCGKKKSHNKNAPFLVTQTFFFRRHFSLLRVKYLSLYLSGLVLNIGNFPYFFL